jgi:hypothetical protein
MNLYPADTLVFVRIAHGRAFIERFTDTATGRLLKDPKLQPFVDRLYGSMSEVYADEAEEKVGLSLDEIRNLPQGEIAFGVIPKATGIPAFAVLFDLGDDPTGGHRLLERVYSKLRDEGSEFIEETVDGTTITTIRQGDIEDRSISILEKDNTVVAATDVEVLRGILSRWNGTENSTDASEVAQSLAQNADFATIVRECRRPQDEPPQLIGYANPIELLREIGRHDGGGLNIALATFPALGLNGIKGAGISMTVATPEYDDLSHMHLLLENPRAGVLQLIAFQTGTTTPQPWVPDDIENYITWNWDVEGFFAKLTALVDKFYYPGGFEERIDKNVSQQLGIDFRTEVIDQLAGRFTWLTAYNQPAKFNGQRNLFCAQVKDEAAAEETLNRVVAKFSEQFERREFGKAHYFALKPQWLEDMPEEQRPFEPAIAVFDGYLFMSYSCQLMERAIATRDGTQPALADSIEYKLTTSKLLRESTGTTPVMVSFSRFEASLRNWYSVLKSDETRLKLDEWGTGPPPAENEGDEEAQEPRRPNRFFAALAECLEEEELPPFDELVKYTAPGGGVIYDTDTGIHAMSFTLRREE